MQIARPILGCPSGDTRLNIASGLAEDCALQEEKLQAMTDRRQLIRDASCWALALSVGLALSTTQSEAQRRRRSGPRFGLHFGWGPQKHCWWGRHGRVCDWW